MGLIYERSSHSGQYKGDHGGVQIFGKSDQQESYLYKEVAVMGGLSVFFDFLFGTIMVGNILQLRLFMPIFLLSECNITHMAADNNPYCLEKF